MTVQPGKGASTSSEADDIDDVADLFRALGRQIKVARERAGLSQRKLGDQLGYGEETISSVERAQRTPQPELLIAVDRLLNCGGLLEAAAEDVRRAKARRRVRHPEWFRDYARLEADAVEICFYSTLTMPGLLQTRNYAQTIFMARRPFLDEETIEQRVAARLGGSAHRPRRGPAGPARARTPPPRPSRPPPTAEFVTAPRWHRNRPAHLKPRRPSPQQLPPERRSPDAGRASGLPAQLGVSTSFQVLLSAVGLVVGRLG
ncbi:Scr1 family TA system antitoxin-like transcriptional regulator [Streptomyces thermogriseus]